MTIIKKIKSNKYLFRKKLEWILLFLSSTLLAIWAVKETIALRNILLVGGSLIAIYLISQELKTINLKRCCATWKVAPIILISLTFIWVIVHYLFFSLDPEVQFKELKSTWLRSLMAAIIGIATGIAVRNIPWRLNLIWGGILITFIVLFYQYLPRAIAQNKLLLTEYHFYLFHLKINTALMGLILLTGVHGALFDGLKANHNMFRGTVFLNIIFSLIVTLIVMWTFVYIVDSRIAVSISIIMYSFWFSWTVILLAKNRINKTNFKNLYVFAISSIGLCLIIYFVHLHTNINNGWSTFVKDIQLSVQINKYTHWQDLNRMGYPKHDDGTFVKQNTYERVAWATAGLMEISNYPLGSGVMEYPISRHPNYYNKKNSETGSSKISTHSAWIELGLAYGIPFLVLIFLTFLFILILALRNNNLLGITITSFIIMVAILYTVGELSTQHGIEILFFILALVSSIAMLGAEKDNIKKATTIMI